LRFLCSLVLFTVPVTNLYAFENNECLACHGEDGHGDGPVGDSYMPVPADLHRESVRRMADGELLLAMLTGTGHAPVLERVVNPDHRWYLVTFTRWLARRD